MESHVFWFASYPVTGHCWEESALAHQVFLYIDKMTLWLVSLRLNSFRYSSLSPYVWGPYLCIVRSHVHSCHVQTHSKYNSVLPMKNGLLRWLKIFNNMFFCGTAISIWTGCLYLSKYIWQIQPHFRLLIFAQVKAWYLCFLISTALFQLFLIQNWDGGFNLQLFISLKKSNSVMEHHERLLSFIYPVENLATYIWNPQFL